MYDPSRYAGGGGIAVGGGGGGSKPIAKNCGKIAEKCRKIADLNPPPPCAMGPWKRLPSRLPSDARSQKARGRAPKGFVASPAHTAPARGPVAMVGGGGGGHGMTRWCVLVCSGRQIATYCPSLGPSPSVEPCLSLLGLGLASLAPRGLGGGGGAGAAAVKRPVTKIMGRLGRLALASRHIPLPVPGTLSLRRRQRPSASHHRVPPLSLRGPILTSLLPFPFPWEVVS